MILEKWQRGAAWNCPFSKIIANGARAAGRAWPLQATDADVLGLQVLGDAFAAAFAAKA